MRKLILVILGLLAAVTLTFTGATPASAQSPQTLYYGPTANCGALGAQVDTFNDCVWASSAYFNIQSANLAYRVTYGYGSSIASLNGYRAANNTLFWCSCITTTATELRLQSDCNIVLYNRPLNRVLWASNTVQQIQQGLECYMTVGYKAGVASAGQWVVQVKPAGSSIFIMAAFPSTPNP